MDEKGEQRDNGKSSMISLSLLINLLMNIGYSVKRAPHTYARPNLSKHTLDTYMPPSRYASRAVPSSPRLTSFNTK
jgi:hypothetical protein